MAVVDDNRNIELIAGHIEEIIKLLGEDCTREGLLKTPIRSAKALYYLTSGYRANIDAVVHQALFEHEGSQIVMVKNIEFYSMCEHHILPFFGNISIGYIPDGKIIGLSKVARLVNVFARRLQVQERLTAQVCREVERIVGAKGVMVVCDAHHLCMKMRGVEKQDSTTSTMDYVGAFAEDPALREEFMRLLGV
ncbi:MAG: GTP cyclohydrolase I FolE [Muribaculaceae bacterium]|nr:GTP cyclohydrolase I FolE [Muribaculaceae bacterium]